MNAPMRCRWLPLLSWLVLVAQPALADQRIERLERLIQRGLTEWRTPGVVVSIVKDDTVVLADGYGVREFGKTARPDEETRFAIGSTSKAFGVAALAFLVEEGKLHWDDRVIDHLPWFQVQDPWVTREMRLRDIVSHRTGYDLVVENAFSVAANSAEARAKQLRDMPPSIPFRSGYMYSNNMFTVAGLVVQAAAGAPWDEYAREKLWEPLGMSSTTTKVDEVLKLDNRATGHLLIEGELVPDRLWQSSRAVFDDSGPSGSVISTAKDMAQWLRLQLGEGRVAGRQLLSVDNVRLMQTPHTPIKGGPPELAYWFKNFSAADMKSHHWAYALGWAVNDYRGRTMVWHGGTNGNMRTVVLLLPEERFGIFISANALTLLPLVVALSAADEFIAARDTDWNAVLLKERRLQEQQERAQAQAIDATQRKNLPPTFSLQDYVGRYRDGGAAGTLDVTLRESTLTLTLGRERCELRHWHGDVFRAMWPPGSELAPGFATFVSDPAGRIRRLDIDVLGTFERVADEGHARAY